MGLASTSVPSPYTSTPTAHYQTRADGRCRNFVASDGLNAAAAIVVRIGT
jgi:hypothetical protein